MKKISSFHAFMLTGKTPIKLCYSVLCCRISLLNGLQWRAMPFTSRMHRPFFVWFYFIYFVSLYISSAKEMQGRVKDTDFIYQASVNSSFAGFSSYCTCVYHLNPTCSSFWSLADDFPIITYTHLVLISMPSAHLDEAE